MHRIAKFRIAVFLTITSGCSGEVVLPPGPPNHIVLVSGGNQVGVVGGTLPAPLRIRVEDVNNKPVPDVPVVWAVIPNSAVITPASRTDASGNTEATVQLGTAAGAYSAAAAYSTSVLSPAFALTAAADIAAKFSIVARGTTGRAGQLLDQSPSIRITDRFGNAVPGATNTVHATLVAGRFADGNTDASAVSSNGQATFTALRFNARDTYRLRYSVDAGFTPLSLSEDTLAIFADTPVGMGLFSLTTTVSPDQSVNMPFTMLDRFQNESNYLDNGFTVGFSASCPSSANVLIFVSQPSAFQIRPNALITVSSIAPTGSFSCTISHGQLSGGFTLKIVSDTFVVEQNSTAGFN